VTSATGATLVRRLAPADAPAYRALMLDGYAGDPDAFTAAVAERDALPLAFWEARLAAGDSPAEIVIGALIDGRLAGALGVRFAQRPKFRHKASLFGMHVAHDARRRGLGRLLVEAALEEARRRDGIILMQLTVTEGNPAPQGLYAACGFVTYGVEPMAVQSGAGYAAQIHMWRKLQAGDNGTL
jgi:ribosomal protein S18 acetylase RimI-like enzyme